MTEWYKIPESYFGISWQSIRDPYWRTPILDRNSIKYPTSLLPVPHFGVLDFSQAQLTSRWKTRMCLYNQSKYSIVQKWKLRLKNKNRKIIIIWKNTFISVSHLKKKENGIVSAIQQLNRFRLAAEYKNIRQREERDEELAVDPTINIVRRPLPLRESC